MAETKPHAVCVPFPGQGHINAMLHLARVLHFKGFFITFVNTEFNHHRILKSGGPSALDGTSDFRFATIPDGLPPSSIDMNQDIPSLCVSTKLHCLTPFRQLLTALNDPSSGGPRVSCVISDSFTSFTLAATAEMGIPNVFFCSVSACGFMSFYSFKELMERNIIPLKCEAELTNGYLDTVIDRLPGMINLRLKDLSRAVQTTNKDEILLNFLMDEAQANVQATAIIFNTYDIEGPVLDALSSILPPIYQVGPLCLLSQFIPRHLLDGFNLWKENSSCIEWLEEKQPGSVLYMNFGSLTIITNEQLEEFAWGLANSGYEFLWVVRPDLVAGEQSAQLPQEFLVETKGRSLITSWCAQEQVLSHAAIGGFLTHCGWNSTLESICAGVPMICWPFFGDQQPNCRYMCSEWGIGMEIDEDVKREKVETLIKELMGGDRGKEMKKKVLQWKEKALEAGKPGGSAWANLEKVISDIIIK